MPLQGEKNFDLNNLLLKLYNLVFNFFSEKKSFLTQKAQYDNRKKLLMRNRIINEYHSCVSPILATLLNCKNYIYIRKLGPIY